MTALLSRRQWLGAGARLAAGAVLARCPTLAAAAEVSRTLRVVAREVVWELAPGKTIRAMAYDGQVPGPEIRLREGERVRVVFENRLSEPTTVHWHGVEVPNAMDGVPGVTQAPVRPGETFVYEFEARPAGTRWYHTHLDEHRQLDRGLAAALVIEPATGDPAVDQDVTLVLDDWATGTGPPVPPTDEGTAVGRGGVGGMMRGPMPGMGGMMGGHGPGGPAGREADEPAYDVMTINGRAWPAVPPLRLRRGERVRLRLINASAEHTHVIRLDGHRLAVTHTDGNPLESPVEVDAVPLAPSERYDVLVHARRPGAWFLFCTQPGHSEAGERMLVLYAGHESRRPDPPAPGTAGLDLWRYGRGRGRASLSPAAGATHRFDLTLSGGMGGDPAWTINGRAYPHTDPLRLERGDRALIVLRNRSMEAHPMHLHGQSFRVLAVNGRRAAAPLVKDSVDVEAHMGSVVLEVSAHNPGDWLFHCHKPTHMMGGMASLVRVAAGSGRRASTASVHGR